MNAHRRQIVTGIVALVAAWPLAQMASAGPPGPAVPTDIQVPSGNKVFLVGHAVGVQIYSCNASASGFSWGLVAPRADLYDDRGKVIVSHFGGPSWQAIDGSKVVGKRDAQVTVDSTAIPWLRLTPASKSAGPDGDRLVGTTFIQRIATTGGLPPSPAECNAETADDQVEIPYTADYYFWKATAT
jgi:hypothetical protein